MALSEDFLPVGDGQALATQRGWRDPAFIAPATRADPSRYYPWWERDVTGPTALALAEAHLWTLFPWRSPLDDFEQSVGEVARDLLMQVRPLPGTWPSTLQELTSLLAAKDFRPPEPAGIGYLRGDMMRPLTGGWAIRLPGWFWDDTEDEGRAVVIWSQDRVVRGSSITIETKHPFDLEEALEEMERDVRHLSEHAAYAGSFEDMPDADWPNGRRFGGIVQFGKTASGVHTQHGCIVSLNYASSDLDDWAREVFLSVAPPEYGPGR